MRHGIEEARKLNGVPPGTTKGASAKRAMTRNLGRQRPSGPGLDRLRRRFARRTVARSIREIVRLMRHVFAGRRDRVFLEIRFDLNEQRGVGHADKSRVDVW
jgi:hypothetical protein